MYKKTYNNMKKKTTVFKNGPGKNIDHLGGNDEYGLHLER